MIKFILRMIEKKRKKRRLLLQYKAEVILEKGYLSKKDVQIKISEDIMELNKFISRIELSEHRIKRM